MSPIVRTGVLDQKSPQSVTDEVDGKKRKNPLPYSFTTEKQREQYRGEREQEQALEQLYGYDLMPYLIPARRVVIDHIQTVPRFRFRAVATARHQATEPTEAVRKRNYASRNIRNDGKAFFLLAVLTEFFPRQKPNQEEARRTADQAAEKGCARAAIEHEFPLLFDVIQTLKKDRRAVTENDGGDDCND